MIGHDAWQDCAIGDYVTELPYLIREPHWGVRVSIPLKYSSHETIWESGEIPTRPPAPYEFECRRIVIESAQGKVEFDAWVRVA